MLHGIKKRTWRAITASILERLVKAPSTQNKIMASTNLNRDTTGIYLQEMVSARLIRILSDPKGHKVYSVTEKGKHWLRIYKSLLEVEESND